MGVGLDGGGQGLVVGAGLDGGGRGLVVGWGLMVGGCGLVAGAGLDGGGRGLVVGAGLDGGGRGLTCVKSSVSQVRASRLRTWRSDWKSSWMLRRNCSSSSPQVAREYRIRDCTMNLKRYSSAWGRGGRMTSSHQPAG